VEERLPRDQLRSGDRLWSKSRTLLLPARDIPREAIDVTASPVHVRISVLDDKLAQADQMTRENSANAIVSAAEGVLAQQGQFASVQVISVAIIHPAQPAGAAAETHTEDVLEFRKGPNQRFAHHIT
jgi:hypothetical protein